MPQLEQAKKALRQDANRRASNDRWRKRLREAMKNLQKAILVGDKKVAAKTLVETTSAIDRAARHNILKPNKASRLKSRLTRQINQLQK